MAVMENAYLFIQQAKDSYFRVSGYPSGKEEKVTLYAREETEPLVELEIKFLPDTARKPSPPHSLLRQKQPI